MDKITSVKNEVIKEIKKIVNDKKSHLFLIEGKKMILEGLRSGFQVETLLCCDEIPEIMSQINKNARIYLVSENVLSSISQIKTNQGVIATFKKDAATFDEIPISGKIIICDGVSDPGNLGTIIRTADAFGIDMVVCINCVNLYNDKVIRSTMGSIFRKLVLVCQNQEDIYDKLARLGYTIYATTLKDGAKSIKDTCLSPPIAVVMGNEARGISTFFEQNSDKLIYIDMLGQSESLNVAVASGVIMWEMAKVNKDE